MGQKRDGGCARAEPETVDWTDDPLAWLTSHQLERCAAVAGVGRPALSLRDMPVELLRVVIETAACRQAILALHAAQALKDARLLLGDAEPRFMRADGVAALVDPAQRHVVAAAIASGVAAARRYHARALAEDEKWEAARDV